VLLDTGVPQYFCNDEEKFDFNDPKYMSKNQMLGNGHNPKTLIPPVVIAPSHALDYWKANNLISHSAVNKVTQQDVYLSGYAVSTCCGNLEGKTVVPVKNGCPMNTVVGGVSDMLDNYSDRREHFVAPSPSDVPPRAIPTLPVTNNMRQGGVCRENFQHDPRRETYNVLTTKHPPAWAEVIPNEPGWVNTACGYNPEQVYDSSLPSNLPAGNCPQTPNLRQFNDNLFTQTIQPGVYTKSQVNEPINANIGISFQQQFEPVTCKRDENGLTYTEHDPRIIEPAEYEPNEAVIEPVTQSNVYDPRFYGYGTSYRSYTEPVTGQTRFMYDDVDAIRMPNYITRNKIDFLPYADSYGPMKPGQEFGNPATPDIRGLANDSWLRNSLQFRNDMMERLMRKRNNEMWQVRQYAKNSMGNCKMSGGSANGPP
jgi:hypothetical protein